MLAIRCGPNSALGGLFKYYYTFLLHLVYLNDYRESEYNNTD